jgi:hypothetical protein
VGVLLKRCLPALFLACAFASPAHAQSVDETCGQVSPSAAPCIGSDKLAEAAAAECRRLGLPEESCVLPLGHRVSTKVVRAYRKTWLHRAAAFQYRIADATPLLDAAWLGTHNSFNSSAEDPTLSHTDSNQQLSLPQQLDLDMRALELDLHYIPRPAAGGASAVVVCHGRGPDEAHLGCTTERTFAEVLPEIGDWLKAHPSEVVLLYLEDELGADAGYAETVSVLDKVLGSAIYRPSPSEMTAKGCANLPLDISRKGIRARGAQVILVGNCRGGWASDVYGWDDNHVESGSTPGYRAYPACDATYDRGVYDSKLVRYYEDSTFVSSATEPTQTPAEAQAQALTPARVADMTRCGVDLFGFDQILPHDGRIDATIWSWAKGQPNRARGRCALQRADGRWVTRGCGSRHLAACRGAGGGWTLTPKAVAWNRAGRACRAGGASFGLPRTGYENAQLRDLAGSRGVWLNYRTG